MPALRAGRKKARSEAGSPARMPAPRLRLKILAATVSVAVSMCPLLGQERLAPEADAQIRHGMEQFKSAHISESIADFDRAIAIQPNLAPYLWQRGIALYY